MANIKISNLPTYSGSAADLRWFVMNNSGNTETFKYSGYSSPFKIVGSNNRIINERQSSADVNGDYSMIIGGNNSTIPGGNFNMIIGAENATNNGSANCVIIGQGGSITDGFGNGIFGGINTVGGNYSATVGGYSNIIGTTFNDRDVIAGGESNIFYNASNSFIGGGSQNDVWGQSVAVIASFNSTLSAGNLTFVGATQDNTITQAGYTYALLGGGYNTVNVTNGAGSNMYSSYFCTDTSTNDTSVLGNSSNGFFNSRNSTITGYLKYTNVFNSHNSNITGNASSGTDDWFNQIMSSSASTITDSRKSQIIGGESNTISGRTRSVMIGTSGRTATMDNATFVENLVIFNYSNLNYADDTAAAAGGVVLGQVYHNNGALRIRIV